MRLFPLSPLLLVLFGCPPIEGTDAGSKDDDIDDSGDTGEVDYGPPGCINLDGETGDFATIAEAVEAADAGRVVNVCAGAYAESVAVPSGVTVVGAGSDSTTIDAPSNTPAFTLTGDASGVTGFTITSTRSGIVLDGAVGATITDVVFDTVANYGVESGQSDDVVVSGCTFYQPDYGGVLVSGGSITLDGNLFSEPNGYGVQLTGGAAGTLTNNIFDQVHATGECSSIDACDGVAIQADGADLVMSGNTVTTSDLFGLVALNGTLSMSNDLFRNNPYGVVGIDNSLEANGLEVYGSYAQGVLFVHRTATLSLTDTVVAVNEESGGTLTSCDNGYDDFSGWCGGVYFQSSSVNLQGLTIGDYNSYGIFVAPYSSGDVTTFTASDVLLSNVGRWGLYLQTVEGTLDGLEISGMREPDATYEGSCYYTIDGSTGAYVDRGTAVFLYGADLAISNAVITDAPVWGLSNYSSDVSLASSTLSGNACAGVINLYGGITATGNTFSGYGSFSTFHSEYGEVLLDSNSFVDTIGTETYTYENDFTGDITRYEYDYQGQDIYLAADNVAVVSNNTFEGGGESIYVYGVGAEITGNSWANYNGNLVYAYDVDSASPLVMENNTAEDFGGAALYVAYGAAEVAAMDIGTTRYYNYAYRYYTNDVLDYEYSYSYANSTFSAYGNYYGYWSDTDGDGTYDTYTDSSVESDLKLENVTVGSTLGSAVSVTNTALELSGVTIGQSGSYAVYAYSYGMPPQVEIDGLTVEQSTYDAVYLVGNATDAGYALVSDVDITEAGGDGLYLSGFAEWSVDDLSVLSASGYGLGASASYSFYDYYLQSSVSGVLDSVGTVDSVEVNLAAYDGIRVDGGSVTITNSLSSGGAGDGLGLGDVNADVQSNSLTGNAYYGMSCSNVSFSACAGNDLSGNTLGTHEACDDACGM